MRAIAPPSSIAHELFNFAIDDVEDFDSAILQSLERDWYAIDDR